MKASYLQARRGARGWILFSLAVVLGGCGAPEAEFRLNEVYLHSQVRAYGRNLDDEDDRNEVHTHARDVADILAALFGTPDDPHVPAVGAGELDELLDLRLLRMAAGPVGRDEDGRPRGLYREHCGHCHGISGDGYGPTAAFLNPYPRDYRPGVFKFKSTPLNEKPTHADMKRLLVEGVPGTAMPSFRMLSDPELEALVHYVRYLSIRGQVERDLQSYALGELDGQWLVDELDFVRDTVEVVADHWQRAEEQVVEVPPPPEDLGSPESLAKGRQLYYGAVANCFKCHGNTGLGDGQTTDYDNWTQELEPENETALQEYLALGALQPRTIRPRNLRHGAYRGGRRPIDLYWRVHNGIDGTPMPKPLMRPEEAPEDHEGLTSDDIWHLVHYVRQLPYEPASQPVVHQTHYQRDSN